MNSEIIELNKKIDELNAKYDKVLSYLDYLVEKIEIYRNDKNKNEFTSHLINSFKNDGTL